MKTTNAKQIEGVGAKFSLKGILKASGKIYLLLLATFLLTQGSFAATITVKDNSLGTGTYSWTKDNIYLLDGFVYLESGGVLNIQAGTIIKGLASPTTGDNASALIITVGAKIYATGSSSEPIIFTSEIDDVSDNTDLTVSDRGLWGGLIILGNGILGNTTVTSNIEGIPTTETRAKFGGSDNANNAGILSYVSIRHGGAELSPGDEINGLTLGGVGSGTTIEHIEIIANSDDGIEFFGGAVNVKYAATVFCSDDGFDWDLGWVGNGQFWFVIQSADAADNGGEWDGAKPDANSIFSNPTIYNATFVGSGTGTVAATNSNAILMRDATGGTVANSVFTEYAHKAMEIEDLGAAKGVDSYKRMQNGELRLLNNIWYGFGSYTTLDANRTTGIIRFTEGGEDTLCKDLVNHLSANSNQLVNPNLKSISRQPNELLDPRPKAGSPAMTNLAKYPIDPFFTTATYKGAFDMVGTSTWLSGWTALDAYGYLTDDEKVSTYAMSELNKSNINIYPNPSNGLILMKFTNWTKEPINFQIYDIYGTLINEIEKVFLKGENEIAWDTKILVPGAYILRVSSPIYVQSQRLIIE